MKPLRLILGLALAAGLFLGFKFLRIPSMEEGGSSETAAAAEESHPNQPSPANSKTQDLFRAAPSPAVSPGSLAGSSPLAADAPLPLRRHDEDLAGSDHPAPEETADPRLVRDCKLALIEEVEIPAEEAGKLMELKRGVKGPDGKITLSDKEVKEGLEVSVGDLLGQIDDTQARMAKEVAECEYRAAHKEAENDVSVRHAGKLVELSDAQFKSSDEANKKAPQSISYYDMRQLLFKCQESRMQVEQAQHDLDVAGLKADAAKAKSDSAGQDIARRQVLSPWSGMIVKRYRHKGEWVKPGDPVFRIIRLDRLRIQAYLDGNRISPADVDGKDTTVKVAFPHGGERTFSGKITFANPIIETDGKFLVYAEVDNKRDLSGHWILIPGQRGELKIEK